MKKLAIFMAAFVLTLGLAQCKKEQPVTPQNTEGNLVHLTVNVGKGSRADVDPPHFTTPKPILQGRSTKCFAGLFALTEKRGLI